MTDNERIARQAGAALRHIRENRGLRQRAVAERAGISAGRLSRYEHGQQVPTFGSVGPGARCARLLDRGVRRYFGPWGEVVELQRQQGAAAAMAAAP